MHWIWNIRKLVLLCVEKKTFGRVENIKSGKKTVCTVLRVVAEAQEPFALGFRMDKKSVTNHLFRIIGVLVDAFECVLTPAVCQHELKEIPDDHEFLESCSRMNRVNKTRRKTIDHQRRNHIRARLCFMRRKTDHLQTHISWKIPLRDDNMYSRW